MSPTGDTRKRQRVSQACHRCRSRKYRCDGARPRCSACVAVASTDCIYEAGSKRRGLTSGYVRALESLWALAFERIPGSKAGVQDLLSHLSATINDVTPQSRAEREEELSRVWRTSGVPSAIESVLTGRPIEAVHEVPQNPTAETSISWALPAAYVPTSPAASNDFTFTDTEVHLPPSPSALPLPIPAPSTVAVQQRPASPIFAPSSSGKHSRKLVPLPDDWLELVQVYLAAEHTWLPVLQRSALFRAASSYQDHVDACLQPSSSDKAEFSCLWAVLVLGEIHAHTASSPRLGVFRRMSQSFVEHVDLFNEGDMLAYPLRYALVYILWTITYMGQKKLFRAKLTLVRAMVLATLDDPSTAGMVSGAWPFRAIVSAACFVLDTILSLGMSSKPMSTNSDLQIESRPLNEESPDEWEPFVPPNIQSQEHDDVNNSTRRAIPNRTCSTFNSLVEILRTLNDLLHSNGGLPRNSERLLVEPLLEEGQSHLSLARQSPAQLHLRLVQLVLYDTSMPAGTPVSTATSNNAVSKPLREQTVALLAHMKSHVGPRLLPASLSALIPRCMSPSSRLYTAATKPPIRSLFQDLDNVWLSDNTTTPGLTCTPSGATGSQALPDRYEHRDMLYTPAGVSASFAGGQIDPLEDGPSVGKLGSRTGTVDASAGNVTFEMQDPRLPADRNCSTEQILETLHMPTSHDDADDSFVHVDPFDDYIALVDSNENSSSAHFLASLGFLSEESFAGA